MKINKQDVVMIVMIPILLIMQKLFEVFNIYHIMLLSACYGGYTVLVLFTSLQKRLAIKKGLLKELEEINELGKKDDKPRWIK